METEQTDKQIKSKAGAFYTVSILCAIIIFSIFGIQGNGLFSFLKLVLIVLCIFFWRKGSAQMKIIKDKEQAELDAKIAEANRVRREAMLKEIFEELGGSKLQSIESDISLPKNEALMLKIDNAHWQEERKQTTGVSYAGVRQRIRIAKGLSFNLGHIAPKAHTSTGFTTIESGPLYLTTKKIMLLGKGSTKNLSLDKIIDIDLFTDGVLLRRDKGKAVLLPLSEKDAWKVKIIIDSVVGAE